MFDRSDSSTARSKPRLGRIGFILALAMICLVASVGWAQVTDSESLRVAVEEQYRVLPVRGGVLLTPIQEMDFSALEVREGEVALDGREIGQGELAALLGREGASLIEELTDLDSEELLELFEFEPSVALEPSVEVEPSAEIDALVAEAQQEVEESLEEARRVRRERLEDAQEDREARSDEIEQELAEIEETHRAITQELRQRTTELRKRERERREANRQRTHDSGQSRVVVGSSVVVDEGENVAEVVAIGGSVTVHGDVRGDAVAIGGRATIDGEVAGGVVAVGGSVHLGENAEIGGDVVSVGGEIRRAPGAEVHGQTTEVNLLSGWIGPWLSDWDWGSDHRPRNYFEGSVGDLIGTLVRAVLFGIAGFLLILFARSRFERAAAYAGAEPLKSGIVGLLVLVMSLPLVVVLALVLAVSVIGIPLILLLPFLMVGLWLLALFGYLATAYQLGRWSQQRFGWRVLEPVAALVIGLVWLHGWGFMADIMDVLDGPHDLAGFLVLLLGLFGFVVKLGAWSVGLGAMLLSWGPSPVGGVGGTLPPVPPAPPEGERLSGISDPSTLGGLAPEFDDSLDVDGVVSAIWDETDGEEVREPDGERAEGVEEDPDGTSNGTLANSSEESSGSETDGFEAGDSDRDDEGSDREEDSRRA